MTLKGLGLPYTDVRLDLFPEIREEVMKRSNMRTVPQIYFNEILIGGNDDLNKLLQEKDHLEELLMKVRTASVPKEGPIIPESSAPSIDSSGCICEPDEYIRFINEFKSDNFVGTHRVGFRFYRNAFTGKDFLTFGTQHKGLEESVIVEVGQALLDRRLIVSVNEFKVFLPTSEVYIYSIDDEAFNSGPISTFVQKTGQILFSSSFTFCKSYFPDPPAVGTELSEELRKTILKLYADFLSEDGKFFNDSKYIIGGSAFSLQDIENGVLRANRRGVGQFSKPFGKDDPRLKVALNRHEPLVHFALVCGARSCPPIKTYTHQNIYKELQLATAAYLESDSGCQVDTTNQIIKLSSIFKWYQTDFGQDKYELVDFVLMYIPAGSKQNDIKSDLLSQQNDLKEKGYKGNIIVYSMTDCPSCAKAKLALCEASVPFIDIRLDLFPQEKYEISNVPAIYFNEIDDKNRFQEMIVMVKNNYPGPRAPVPPNLQKKPSVEIFAPRLSSGEVSDNYFKLEKLLRLAGIIGTHRSCLRRYENSFLTNELMEYSWENGLD
ncbi:hypothetical protein Btru_040194, partial [Bulinus truncatus]